jgi:HSP20 family protein
MWEDPFNELRRLRKEMDKLFDKFFSHQKINYKPVEKEHFKVFREPLSDLKETDTELIASIELPGIDKKDIQLIVRENRLEVKVEKRAELKIKKKNYLREERSYKGFHRIIGLPVKVIPEDVESKYENGILEIRMPKAEKKKLRKIEIK